MSPLKSIFEKITIEKSLIYLIIIIVIIIFFFIFYFFFSEFNKGLVLTSPIGGEEWEVGGTYKITWQARNIDKIGIVLYKGKDPQWIAKDIYAGVGSYEWRIFPGQPYGPDYWVAIFEYPWKEGNKISYSGASFSLIFPKTASCEGLSIENQWPYISSVIPDLRYVFITDSTYNGNLGGLEGADKICQEEAQKKGFNGVWHAFIGGDEDNQLAIRRIKTKGIFVDANSSLKLSSGDTCHRLIAKDFNEFLSRFSTLSRVNQEKLEKNFLKKLDKIWLGRFDEKSKKNCIPIEGPKTVSLQERYSYTSTCQNWTNGERVVSGYYQYLQNKKENVSLPTCYTEEGKYTEVAIIGGLSTGLTGGGEFVNSFTPYQGKNCSTSQYLLCISE